MVDDVKRRSSFMEVESMLSNDVVWEKGEENDDGEGEGEVAAVEDEEEEEEKTKAGSSSDTERR